MLSLFQKSKSGGRDTLFEEWSRLELVLTVIHTMLPVPLENCELVNYRAHKDANYHPAFISYL